MTAVHASSASSHAGAYVSGDAHPVSTVLSKKGDFAVGMKLRKAIKKPKGTLALIGEGVFCDSPTLGGYDLNDPEYLSEQFRTAGCASNIHQLKWYRMNLGLRHRSASLTNTAEL